MFRTLLIGASEHRRQVIQAAASATQLVLLVHSFESYPDSNSISGMLARYEPRLVIVDGEDVEKSLACMSVIRQQSPDLAILGINATRQANGALSAALARVVPFPPDVDVLAEGICAAVHDKSGQLMPNLIAFLPAKAGSGASTVALNTAAAFAALGEKVLLVDADLRSGALSLMLDCTPEGSTQRALKAASEEDVLGWNSCVTSVHNIDFLLSSRESTWPPPTWAEYYALLRFAASRYTRVLVDLPELVNPATVEVVRSAGHVLVVSTQELIYIKMAERRIKELRNWGVPEERLKILVNRWHKHEIRREEIEAFLSRPVFATLENDFPAVRAATLAGQPVSPSSSLGKEFRSFVYKLSPEKEPSGWFKKLRSVVAGAEAR